MELAHHRLEYAYGIIGSLGQFGYACCTDGPAEGGVHRGVNTNVIMCRPADQLLDVAGAVNTFYFKTKMVTLVLALQRLATECQG